MKFQELYSRLANVREQLKTKFYANGRTPTICSDEALYELAGLAPRRKEDLCKITGLGETFVEKYGDYFMVVLNQYHNSNISTKELNEQVKSTLKNLENRLVNISKRNRLLYMGKIYNKYAFDLFANNEFTEHILGLLFGRRQSIKLCNVSGDDAEDEKRYKKVLALIREIQKEFRENGQYDLYIGYPYVMGKARGEDFNVRAPLVLFPIIFDRADNEIKIKLDKTKDILFNNNIILLQNKFLSKNDELPNNVLDDIDPNSFLQQIKDYYLSAGIELKCNGDIFSLSNFKDIRADHFPAYASGEFEIVPNAVLGKFSLCSNALQKDFKEMINDTEINELLDDLLSGMDSIDFYTDEISFDEDDNAEITDFSEKDINYINELNSSQEQAILKIDRKDKLVIQGPPGTGKSQTITSLIADTVNKGHNVLMVSQKKAALDVIYSRLGNLSNFAILLSDVKNKEVFYKQLYNLFVSDKSTRDVDNDLRNVSLNIDEQIKSLECIADKLYSTKVNGVEMYKIYQSNNGNTFKSKQANEEIFYRNVPQDLIGVDYTKLAKMRDKFANKYNNKKLFDYFNIIGEVPFVVDIKDKLNNYDINQMKQDFNSFVVEQNQFLNKSWISRLFASAKRKRSINTLYKKYFLKGDSKKEVYKNPELLNKIPALYFSFQEARSIVAPFDETERIYGKAIYDISKELTDSTDEINTQLFDFIINCIIQDFEHSNSGILSSIYNFRLIIQQITSSMQKKKELSKTKLKDTLVSAFYGEILQSKSYNEICRQIENSRKWSVQKFLKKFGFELFKGIKIWLMTPETVSEVLPLEKGLFDLLIFDEASQIYIEKSIPAISRTRKVVIAGDHKQLRPSSLGFGRIEYDEEVEDIEEENAALEEESLLDLARFKYPSVLLNYHYRSRYEELINFSNYAFYNGRLNVSPNTKEPDAPPIEVIKIDNGLWEDRSNRNEALKVVETVKNFLKNRKRKETLGVITFNSNQRDLILDELDKECLKDREFSNICKKEFERKENGEDFGLFVKNIENVQGDERDCIIFSTGYAKNTSGRVIRNFGWLNQKGGENRLNVAISRAKEKIYIVTSIMPNELYVDDLKNNGPKILRKYLEYCYAISDKDTETAKRILYSLAEEKRGHTDNASFDNDFENQIREALINKGFAVDTQVGVGDYKIDLAIRNKANNYVLGIECDGKLYHSLSSARERDIYRQKYLESRGWKIYRIWSTNWWHNPDKEIENIIDIYQTVSQK